MSNGPLRADRLDVLGQEGVLHLVLDRPAKRNALSAELRERLADALDRAADDETVGAVVVSGAGNYFCAGFDLLEYAEAADPAALFADSTRYHRSVHTFAKPIIAAIEGSAVAGGLDLALMCDLRVASDQATFGQPQVRHGIPAAYDLLAPVVGDSIARDLCLSGRLLTAEDALQCGLVQRIVNAGAVVDEALALAADFAALPGSAATKQMFLANQSDLFPAS